MEEHLRYSLLMMIKIVKITNKTKNNKTNNLKVCKKQ